MNISANPDVTGNNASGETKSKVCDTVAKCHIHHVCAPRVGLPQHRGLMFFAYIMSIFSFTMLVHILTKC